VPLAICDVLNEPYAMSIPDLCILSRLLSIFMTLHWYKYLYLSILYLNNILKSSILLTIF
jgi:hypothetical protein